MMLSFQINILCILEYEQYLDVRRKKGTQGHLESAVFNEEEWEKEDEKIQQDANEVC